MSLKSSEDNYKLAKKIYQTISEVFYSIENDNIEDEDYLIDQTLDHIKHLNRIVNKINLDDLSTEYSVSKMDILENNINAFKEASYYIERSLSSMQLYNKLNPILGPYMKRVDWNKIGSSEQKAAKAFGAFLTNEDNYEDFKSIINKIIKGTITAKGFQNLFNSVSERLPRNKPPHVTTQTQVPPEMWDEDKRNNWEDQKKQRRHEALSKSDNDKPRNYGFDESFITINNYTMILESLAYYCNTCGERAEHEEIEDNPRMVCPNCGDVAWEQEY